VPQKGVEKRASIGDPETSYFETTDSERCSRSGPLVCAEAGKGPRPFPPRSFSACSVLPSLRSDALSISFRNGYRFPSGITDRLQRNPQVTPEFLIGGHWDSRDFYVWDHHGKLIRKVASKTGNAYQDMKFGSDQIIASGGLSERRDAVDWLEFPSMHLVRRMMVGKTDRGALLGRETMTTFEGQLWMLREDEQSRLFVFPGAGLDSPDR
jgi:hypothetical protein